MKIKLTFLLFILSSSLFSQNIKNLKEDVNFRVYYEHQHVRDTSKRENIYKENMVLLLGNEHSLFVSYDKLMTHTTTQNMIEKDLGAGNTNLTFPHSRQIIPQEHLLSYSSNEVVESLYLARHYYIQEVLPAIDWTMTDSAKIIEGISCQRATTTYMGRNWSVWFAPEISIPAGPWLLRGLPGLIMEAFDSGNEVVYSFIRLESAKETDEIFKDLPEYQKIGITNRPFTVPISRINAKKLLEQAQKDLNAFRFSQMQSIDFNSSGYNSLDFGISGNSNSWTQHIPNPIARKHE